MNKTIKVTDGIESIEVEVAEIPNAKMLRFSISIAGTEYARVLALPIAEKVAVMLGEDHLKYRESIAKLLG